MQELWIGYYSGAIAALIITTVTHYFAPDFFPFAVAGFVLITPAAIAIYRYGGAMLPEVTGYPQEHELRAMPLMERLAHAHLVAMTEDKESIEMAAVRIAELEAERDLWRNHAINQYARRTGISLDDDTGLKAIEKLLNET